MDEEMQLIERCRKRDEFAFRQLIENHEQQVRATVFGMLGNKSTTDDIAQEVFIRFFNFIDQFKGDAKLSTYLTRIAINLSLNEIKRQKLRQSRFKSLEEEGHSLQIEDRDAGPMRSDMKDNIDHAIQMLSPDFRSVIVLRLVKGYSVKETADILKLPQGTVASRLARAQKKLRILLKPLML